MRIVRFAELVGVNSIPMLGVFAGDWSSSTALTVYWVENLLASALIAARLALHRRWHRAAGNGAAMVAVAKPPGELLLTAVPFTLAHGLFLAVIFAMVTQLAPDREQVRQAVLALVVVQGLAFGFDLWTLGDWPAARINARADHLMGRVVLVHLSIIFGMLVAAWLDRPASFFGFFVGCKVIADLSQFLPALDQGTPDRPPRWLAALMRHVPTRDGETFEEYWRRTHQSRDQGPGTRDQGTATAARRPAWRVKKKRR